MLNYLWAFMMVAGVLWAAFHGNLSAVTDGALSSAKEAVMLCITMLGVMSFWSGIMEIGQKSGLIERLSHRAATQYRPPARTKTRHSQRQPAWLRTSIHWAWAVYLQEST